MLYYKKAGTSITRNINNYINRTKNKKKDTWKGWRGKKSEEKDTDIYDKNYFWLPKRRGISFSQRSLSHATYNLYYIEVILTNSSYYILQQTYIRFLVFHCIMGILHSVFKKFLDNKERRLLMVGLDASGKTTVLFKLKLGENVHTIPTIGKRSFWSAKHARI